MPKYSKLEEVRNTLHLKVEIGGITCMLISSNTEFLSIVADRYRGFLSYRHHDFEITVKIKHNFVLPEMLHSQIPDIEFSNKEQSYIIKRADFIGYIDIQAKIGEVTHSLNPYSIDSFLRIVYSLILVKESGFLLHASSVVRNRKSYLFSGKSGAGKTTIANLSADCTLLSDELSLVKKVNGESQAFGTPFWGELQKNGEKISAPISGIYFIRKANCVEIKKITVSQALWNLMPNILYFAKEPQIVKAIFEVAYEFIADIPAYILHFSKNNQFWRAIDNDR